MIDIPGYRVLRVLGSGGMATVYLAHDVAADREVALKVTSPALLADADFAVRFLREARIAACLSHPNILRIHDVARSDDHYYIAMEYLAGGSLLDTQHTPMPIGAALRTIREIAAALGYLHAQSFVHRDVKTDNILLRADGTAVLTDFGIVRANPAAARISIADAVIGTPQYMSPEQARGERIDGRADLYALGIVLFELLTGHVPYQANDSVTLGLRHIDDPLPQLPDDLAIIQPLLDRLLAKQPAQRFQTGEEVVEAVAHIEAALGSEASEPTPVILDATEETIAPWDAVDTRPQPELGALDGLVEALADRTPIRPRQRSRASKTAWLPALIVAVLFAAVAGFWFNQDGLRALLPETQLNRLLDNGKRALADGRIDGSDNAALESFRSARALEPDNEVARAGLASVAERLLERGREALAKNDLTAARQAVATARDIRGGGADIDTLSSAIDAAETGRDDDAQLLEAGDKALAAGRIVGANGAIAAYRKLERNEHAAAIARAGLLKAGKRLEADADAALAKGDLAAVAARIDDLARNLPEYPGLADLRGRLAAARQSVQKVDARVAEEAQQALPDEVGDEGNKPASALPQRAPKDDQESPVPEDDRPRSGQALLISANAAIEDGDIESASQLLAEAATLGVDRTDLRQAQNRLRDMRESRDIQDEQAQFDQGDVERVRQLLVQGRAAARRGALMDPPQSSAYDYYRAALAIDPGNVAAADGLRDLPDLARRRFHDRLDAGNLSAASAELEVVRQLAPSDRDGDRDTDQLLQAALAQAATRIGERRPREAERALSIARDIDPGNRELVDLERELAMLRQ